MFKQICAGFMVLLGALLAFTPAASQDGRGVIIEPASSSGQVCTISPCDPLSELLFPTLFDTDPATGSVISATADSTGLVINPALQDGDVQTLQLRDDLKWSDGVPVTAYDVLFTYLWQPSGFNESGGEVSTLQGIVGAQVIDEHTITFRYAAPDCASFARSNIRLVPSHYMDPNFQQVVATMKANTEEIPTWKMWYDAYPQIGSLTLAGNPYTMPSAGEFLFNEIRPGEGVRLVSGSSAFIYATTPDGMSATEFFLQGKANVLINPPLERRDDIRATAGLQIADMPSGVWDAIVFNTADRSKPKSAYSDEGKLLDQGNHPLFSDVRVRQAVQMAIDVHEIIEVVFHGNATPMASSLPPTSWGFNPDLKPSTYDPIGAGRLLEAAGWKDVNQDGIRECHGCLYGREGAPLQFDLGAEPFQDLYEAADIIVRQLQKVGFAVSTFSDDSTAGQFFDAHLTTRYEFEPDPDQSRLFTREGDVLGVSGNDGSYYNEQIETLMEQARSVPGCDQETRAKLYQQIQALLQEDQPYAFLYARDDMYVAQGGVMGFAPYAGNPFWNIRDWVVTQ